jgi:imidazolonepropionase-like amidohydrolase
VRKTLLLMLLLICRSAWPQVSDRAVVITHVTVINPTSAYSQSDSTVVVIGERIVRVGSSKNLKVAGAVILDGSGKFLIPALWDMHVHIENPDRDFPMFVANGILGVRNMAGIAKDVFRWREDTASGRVLGPQIVACGSLIDGPNPAHPEHAISVHNAAEGRQAVRSLKAMGADFVKVYDGVPKNAYFAIAAEAKQLHLPFVGHVPGEIRIREASDAGQHSLEHGAYLSGGSTFEDEKIKEEMTGPDFMEEARQKNDFSIIPENIAKIGNQLLDHLSQPRLADLYKTFVKNDTYLTPTLAVQHERAFVDQISTQPDPRMRYIPKAEQESWKPENDMFSKYRTPAYIAYLYRDYSETQKGLRLAQSLGVQLLAGTDVVAPDTFPGFSLHEELQLLVQAGLTPLEALRAATSNPARFFGMNNVGAISPGMKANMVLLDADPTVDIANATKISAVIMRGTAYRRSQLDELLSKAASAAARQVQ